MFEPIDAKRAYESIVSRIERTILDGHFQLGDQLPSERDLASEFGVSRVVIREAIRNLEARGIVKVRHGSGTYVKAKPGPAISKSLTLLLKLEEASLLDLYVVRQALELVSAPRAAQFATSEDIEALRRCLGEISDLAERGIDTEEKYLALIEKDTEFHLLMAEASHNLPLATLLDAILPLMNSTRRVILGRVTESGERGYVSLYVRHRPEQIAEELRHLLNAIIDRDPSAAEHFIYQHLQNARAGFRDLQAEL